MDILPGARHIYLVGIGGISMSGLARMMLAHGKRVSGSDNTDSELLGQLKKEGVDVRVGHAKENIADDVDLVVYSAAVPEDNVELAAAREREIQAMARSAFLGEITKNFYTIAIAGTHGKTTTTAMLTKILEDTGLDPTALLGSLFLDTGSNYRAGKSNYLIVEACEYERQFLDLNPSAAVITNIEPEHLDYYKDLADIQKAFGEFVENIPGSGVLVVNAGEEAIAPVVDRVTCKIRDYTNLSDEGFRLQVPGAHNLKNAKAALALAVELGVPGEVAVASLNEYTGSWRRFEHKGARGGIDVYDDYAHHPAEIHATLQGAREKFPTRTIVVVFQPHLFSRTKYFLDEFGKSFQNADEVILVDIYPAREKDDGTIHSRDVVEKINQNGGSVLYAASFDEAAKLAQTKAAPDGVVIAMGAGSVGKATELIVDTRA